MTETHNVVEYVTCYLKSHCFACYVRAVPKRYFLLLYFRLLKIDELQSSNFSPEVKFQEPGCKALNCFYRVALEDIVVGEKFLYFFLSFRGFLGSRNDGKFLAGTDVNGSAC